MPEGLSGPVSKTMCRSEQRAASRAHHCLALELVIRSRTSALPSKGRCEHLPDVGIPLFFLGARKQAAGSPLEQVVQPELLRQSSNSLPNVRGKPKDMIRAQGPEWAFDWAIISEPESRTLEDNPCRTGMFFA
jgi:hypothetical protein